MDFITDLPLSKGFDSILVIVNHGLTKTALFHSCFKTSTAEDTADMIHQLMCQRFRLADTIISDRGPQFAAHAFQALGKVLGLELHMSTVFHPQTDSQTERTNQTLESYLCIFCKTNPGTWAEKLTDAEIVHNTHMYEELRISPFEVLYGYQSKLLPLAFTPTDSPSADQILQRR